MWFGWLRLGMVLLLFLLSSHAWADEAQDAFTQGMKALGQAKYDQACDHFARAEELGGRTVKTRYQLGRCNEERGNEVEAHEAFLDAAQLAEKEGDTKRAGIARKRVVELEKRVPMLLLRVPDAARLEGLAIAVDGRTVEEPRWGTPIAVQPGEYVVTVSATGMDPVKLEVTAPEAGQQAELVIPTLVPPAPAGPPAVGGAVADSSSTPPPDENDEDDDDDGPGRRSPGLFWTGVGLTAAGGLGVLVGSAYAAISAAADSVLEGGGSVGEGVAILVVGGVMVGVGIPFMVIFGADAEEEPAEAWYVEPLIGPTGGGIRVTF